MRPSLSKLAVLAALTGVLTAATTPRDCVIDLIETTYRAFDNNSGEIIYHERMRALTAQGRSAVSRIQVNYIPGLEDVEFKFIRTIKKDGSIVNAEPSSAFDTVVSEDPVPRAFTDERLKIALPANLDTGDAVEYEAVKHIHRWIKSGDFWFTHRLTTSYPVTMETVALDLPAERGVKLHENPALQGKTETVAGRRIERWSIEHPDEKPGIDARTPLFAVSSIVTWDALGQWFHSLNESAVTPTPEISALAAKLTAGKQNDLDRIAALYSYVANKVRYVAIVFGMGRYQPHAAATVLHNGFGDCKDQTALLSALLTAAGFKPHAVLAMAGEEIRDLDAPAPDRFNHEFTAVETKAGLVFLDAAAGPAPPQVLAPGVRGKNVMLVGDSGGSLVPVPAKFPVPTRFATEIKGRISAAGVFEGSTRFEFQGLLEALARRFFVDAADNDKEKILREFIGPEFRNASVRQLSSSDPQDLSKPFWIQCELNATLFPPTEESFRMTFGWSGASPQQAYQQMPASTKLPQIEPVSITTTMDLTVDQSLTIVDSLPVHRKTDFGAFDSEFSYENGHLLLKRTLELTGKQVPASEWKSVADFMSAVSSESARGFALERQTSRLIPGGTPAATTPLGRAIQEGSAAYGRRDYEAARKSYLEATAIDPKSVNAWRNLGRAYQALRDYTNAEAAYQRVLSINPKDTAIYTTLGILYRLMKRDDDAIAAYRKQTGMNPRDRAAHNNLAVIYAERRQWEQAEVEAAIAASMPPQDAAHWARLMRAQVRSGHIGEAEKSLEHALNLSPDAITENDLAYYMTEANIQLDRAWQLIIGTLNPEAGKVCEPEHLERKDPCAVNLRRLGFMLDTAGWVLYSQGKYAEAEPYLLSSHAIAPRADVSLHRAALLIKLGRRNDGLAAYADALAQPDFATVDTSQARREIAKALGGESQLKAPQPQPSATFQAPIVHVRALVDGAGKVLEAASISDAPQAAIDAVKQMTLAPIAWPDHTLRSTRAIEMHFADGRWFIDRSLVLQQ